jgi:hypothetical protein
MTPDERYTLAMLGAPPGTSAWRALVSGESHTASPRSFWKIYPRASRCPDSIASAIIRRPSAVSRPESGIDLAWVKTTFLLAKTQPLVVEENPQLELAFLVFSSRKLWLWAASKDHGEDAACWSDCCNCQRNLPPPHLAVNDGARYAGRQLTAFICTYRAGYTVERNRVVITRL